MKNAPSASDWLFRLPLGVPWATLSLVAGCLLVSAPLFVDPHYYYVRIGVSDCEIDAVMYWYHPLLTNFVHGVGCGFPPAWLHLAINCSLFLLQGALVERLLGSGRFALLTGANLIVGTLLMQWLVGGRGHGASGMSWSYGLFCVLALHALWRDHRARMFRDPLACLMLLSLAMYVAGLIVRWHVYCVLVSLPFIVVWRRQFLEALTVRSRQPQAGDRLGSALFGLVLAFNLAIVSLIIARVLPPGDRAVQYLPDVRAAARRATCSAQSCMCPCSSSAGRSSACRSHCFSRITASLCASSSGITAPRCIRAPGAFTSARWSCFARVASLPSSSS